MGAAEIGSLIASLVALGIALFAVWLSVVFYRMSTELSDSTKEAAKGIGASVDRLEKVFDTLYSDTFSLMRDTVSDMRKHIWPEETKPSDKISEEAEKRADQKVDALKAEIGRELAGLLERQQLTDVELASTRSELRSLVERAITESRKVEVEAREETVRGHILRQLRRLLRHRPFVTARELVDAVGARSEFSFEVLVNDLEKMKEEGIVHWEGKGLEPDSEIVLAGKR